MKKISDRILSLSANIALRSAVVAAGLASMGGLHQPKEPENLMQIADRRKKKT